MRKIFGTKGEPENLPLRVIWTLGSETVRRCHDAMSELTAETIGDGLIEIEVRYGEWRSPA